MAATATKQNVCRWLARPVSRDNGWHRALLAINGVAYRAEAMHCQDGDSGLFHMVIDLRKQGGNCAHHRVIFDPSGDGHCSCEHATYRGVVCKHAKAMRAALERLEQLELAEADAHAARRAVVEGFEYEAA